MHRSPSAPAVETRERVVVQGLTVKEEVGTSDCLIEGEAQR
jgi:hypothetical protein